MEDFWQNNLRSKSVQLRDQLTGTRKQITLPDAEPLLNFAFAVTILACWPWQRGRRVWRRLPPDTSRWRRPANGTDRLSPAWISAPGNWRSLSTTGRMIL